MNQKGLVTIISVILVVIIASLAILTGCSAPASPTSQNPAGTNSNAAPVSDSNAAAVSAASQQVYNLKFTDQYTPIMEDAKINELLGSLMEEHTGGKVKVTYYHAESLGKTGDFLNLLDGGVADIASLITGWFPQSFSFFMGLEIPGTGFTDRGLKLKVDWELFKAGYLKEFDKYKVLAFNPSPAMNIYMKDNAPTVASLKGKKIRASNATVRVWLENIGTTPVAMASPDVYMALDRGTLDGVYTGYTNYIQQKYFEVVKNAIWNPISMGSSPTIMRKAAWDALPADVQAGVDKAIEAYRIAYLEHFMAADEAAVSSIQNQGVNLYSLEGEEAVKLIEAAAPLKEEWIIVMEAKGLPAREMLDEAAKILAQK
jgi:TRAP-type C4-dicarboxylate transport system substrate-binding protein